MDDSTVKADAEIPDYDSCQPCVTLKRINTTIGDGYGCEVCQMTYIQTGKGAYIPFDQAAKLYSDKVRREAKRRDVASRKMVAKPPKKKKRKKRYR